MSLLLGSGLWRTGNSRSCDDIDGVGGKAGMRVSW
jgi:hypothetical protein